ncbi:MAG: BatA domain-containing protein [Ignavibacteriales bacterium]|nr:BatA domain-containing protein [Ignavibacteriales bacterium]
MTFLNPAVLFGLIATAIPVLIHLLNLRKLKRIDFSTLTFLKELQKNKIRKIKLKQWLLLLLRFLIILFLVGAFARPAIKGVAIGGTTSSAKTTAVFILDNTFSMSVVNEKGSYFNRAKQVVKTLLNQLQEGDEVALISAADISKEEIQPTTNLNDFRKLIDETEISSVSGTLHNSILKAAKLFEQSKNFNKEIYILSDYQKTRLTNSGDAISNLSQLLDDKVKMYLFDFSGKEIFNLGIDNFEANNQIFEKDKPISFTATVTNYSKQPANNVVASLYVNGERSAQQSINLAEGESEKIIFETVLKSTGYIDVMTAIEDDDVLQDNKRYLNLSIPEKISVIIFTETETDSKFLELALTAGEENKHLILTRKNFNQLPSANLNNYDVVLFVGTNFLQNSDRAIKYLSNGGSVFLMPGTKTSLNDFKEACSKLQLPVPVSEVGKEGLLQSVAAFDKVEFEHPVFANIFEKKAKKQVESPEIYHYFKIFSQGKGKSIILLSDNSSFFSEYKYGKGKIFVMSSAPALSWTNLPLKGIFVPMIYKSVFYLSSKDNQITSYLTGDNVNISLQNNTFPQIKIVKPDKNEEFVNLNNQSNQNYLSYNKTETAGNYKIYSGEKLTDKFAVNINPLESNTTKLTSGEIDDYLKKINFNGKVLKLDPDENYSVRIQQARFGSELWRLFLIVAFVLALLEMLIARSAKKDLV